MAAVGPVWTFASVGFAYGGGGEAACGAGPCTQARLVRGPAGHVPCGARACGPVAKLAAFAALTALKQSRRVRLHEARCARGPQELRSSAPHIRARTCPTHSLAARSAALGEGCWRPAGIEPAARRHRAGSMPARCRIPIQTTAARLQACHRCWLQGGGGACGRRPHSRSPGCGQANASVQASLPVRDSARPRAWAGERRYRRRAAATDARTQAGRERPKRAASRRSHRPIPSAFHPADDVTAPDRGCASGSRRSRRADPSAASLPTRRGSRRAARAT